MSTNNVRKWKKLEWRDAGVNRKWQNCHLRFTPASLYDSFFHILTLSVDIYAKSIYHYASFSILYPMSYIMLGWDEYLKKMVFAVYTCTTCIFVNCICGLHLHHGVLVFWLLSRYLVTYLRYLNCVMYNFRFSIEWAITCYDMMKIEKNGICGLHLHHFCTIYKGTTPASGRPRGENMDLLFWPEKPIGRPFSSEFICFQALLAMLWWYAVHSHAICWLGVRHRPIKLSATNPTCAVFAVRFAKASYTRICPGYMYRILYLVSSHRA